MAGLWIPLRVSTAVFGIEAERRRKGRFLRTSGVFRFDGQGGLNKEQAERNLRQGLRGGVKSGQGSRAAAAQMSV